MEGKEVEGGMFGGSEFITGGGCGCTDGGDVKHGGGLFEDLRPTQGIANFYPFNWTLHGIASSLMLLGIILLVVWMFMPDADNALAISGTAFLLFYVIVDFWGVVSGSDSIVYKSVNRIKAELTAKAASSLANAVTDTMMSQPII